MIADADVRAALNAAAESFHEIARAYAARRLKPRLTASPWISAKLEEDERTDEQIDKIAMDSFEALVEILVKLGEPGAAIYACTPSDAPTLGG